MTVHTLIRGLLVLSVALLVPTGLAAERPDDREGPIGVGGVTQAEVTQFEAYGTADTIEARIAAGLDAFGNEVAAVRPDDLAERFTPGMAEQAPVLPDDRAERFTPDSAVPPVVSTATADSWIDWGDPLVVGALTALVAGLATVAVLAIAHSRGGGPRTRGTHGRPLTH